EFNANPDPAVVQSWLTFVIVGGGPTGVELAGMLCELAHETLRGNFRHIDPRRAEIIVFEAPDRLLSALAPRLSAKARASLERLGATVRTSTPVVEIQDHQVTIKTASGNVISSGSSADPGGTQIIAARTVLWAAGVQASALGKCLE